MVSFNYISKEKVVEQLSEKTSLELNRLYKSENSSINNYKYLIEKMSNLKEMDEKVLVRDNAFKWFVSKYPFNSLENDNTGTQFSKLAIDLYKMLDNFLQQRRIRLGKLKYNANELKMSIPFTVDFCDRKFYLENAKPIRVGWNNFKIYVEDENGNRMKLIEFQIKNFYDLASDIESFLKTIYF